MPISAKIKDDLSLSSAQSLTNIYFKDTLRTGFS